MLSFCLVFNCNSNADLQICVNYNSKADFQFWIDYNSNADSNVVFNCNSNAEFQWALKWVFGNEVAFWWCRNLKGVHTVTVLLFYPFYFDICIFYFVYEQRGLAPKYYWVVKINFIAHYCFFFGCDYISDVVEI